MFKYVKSLEYPINIKKKDLKMAKYIVTQYGGANCKRDQTNNKNILLYLFVSSCNILLVPFNQFN